MRFRLHPGAAFFRLGERAVIFDERAQQLVDLDPPTALVSCLLGEPATFEGLVGRLADHFDGPEAAKRQAVLSLASLSELGLVEAAEAPGAETALIRAVRLCGLACEVAVHHEALLPLIEPLLATLPAEPLPDALRYHVLPWHGLVLIMRAGHDLRIVGREAAAPTLKALLTDAVLAEAGASLFLHASMLVRDGRALLLCGSPGAGKSSLAFALAAQGFAFAGDDVVALRPDGRLAGLCFPFTLKSGSWDLFPGHAAAIRAALPHRRLDGKDLRYVAPPGPVAHEAVVVATPVLLRRAPGAAAAAEPVEPVEALAELMAGAHNPAGRLDAAQLALLAGLACRPTPMALHYSDLADAARCLLDRHDRF